jgi:hypothetical protein
MTLARRHDGAFWLALAAVPSALWFAYQTLNASGGDVATQALIRWVPRAYGIEAVMLSALVAGTLYAGQIDTSRKLRISWFAAGLLAALAAMGLVTAGRALVPGAALTIAATVYRTRQAHFGFGGVFMMFVAGVVTQIVLMLLVIFIALTFQPQV